MRKPIDKFRPISSNGFPQMQKCETGVYVHLVDYIELEEETEQAADRYLTTEREYQKQFTDLEAINQNIKKWNNKIVAKKDEQIEAMKCEIKNGKHIPCKEFQESDLDIELYQEGYPLCPFCSFDLRLVGTGVQPEQVEDIMDFVDPEEYLKTITTELDEAVRLLEDALYISGKDRMGNDTKTKKEITDFLSSIEKEG